MQTVNLDGRTLAFVRSGTGSPAVVLETGLGAESAEWETVQRSVDRFAQVLRYDRAGRGASPAVASSRCASELVADLRRLLRAAAIPAPYILVGHSFGGLLARLYAQRHREELAGLILLDAMHEDQFEVLGPLFPAAVPGEPAPLAALRAFWTGGWRHPESTAECIDLVASTAEARQVGSLADLPIRVITAGTFIHNPLIPERWRAALQSRWESLQRQFLRLSSDATQIFAPQSGHFLQRDAPALVSQAIESLHAQVRAASPRRADSAA